MAELQLTIKESGERATLRIQGSNPAGLSKLIARIEFDGAGITFWEPRAKQSCGTFTWPMMFKAAAMSGRLEEVSQALSLLQGTALGATPSPRGESNVKEGKEAAAASSEPAAAGIGAGIPSTGEIEQDMVDG